MKLPQTIKTGHKALPRSSLQRRVINGAFRQSQLGGVSSSSRSEDFRLSKGSAFHSGAQNDSHEISGARQFLCHSCVLVEDEDD